MTDIVEQARKMSAMLAMGERIPYGADANLIDAMAKEIEGLRHSLRRELARRKQSDGVLTDADFKAANAMLKAWKGE